jgi:hypothetical protein
MKTAALERLFKRYVLPSLPGFAIQGKLLFSTPVSWLLLGVVWEQSSWAAGRGQLTAFAQGLFVPKDFLVLSNGKRIGRSYIDVDPDAPEVAMRAVLATIRDEGVPFLRTVGELAGFERHLVYREREVAPTFDSHIAENLAYARVVAGHSREAVTMLHRIVEATRRSPKSPEWVQEQGGRAELMLGLVGTAPDLAVDQLREWRRETMNALRLEKWVDPEPR